MTTQETATEIIVSDELGRTLHIRPKMNWAIRQKARGAAWHGNQQEGAETHFDTGDWNLTLLSLMITKWSGIDLKGKPISRQTLMSLPESCDALLEEALGAIALANVKPDPPEATDDPNG